MSACTILAIISAIIFNLSLFFGYSFCYFFLGPRALKKHGRAGVVESLLWPGNIIHVENELEKLQSTNDPRVFKTLRLMKFSKYTILTSFVLFILFLVIDGVYNR